METETPPLAVDGIPDELKRRAQWVCWRYGEVRPNGRRAKEPYSPRSGRTVDITRAKPLYTYAEVSAACPQAGYDGIGFAFRATDPYCGVDLDNCRDQETGDIARWAQDIIDRLNTYTEVSPSGTGVKLVMRAKKPGGQCKRGSIEVYDVAHFFTLTGLHLAGTPSSVEDRYRELTIWYDEVFPAQVAGEYVGGDSRAVLSDEDILARAMRAPNGDKFARLWAGDTSGYLSASEADLALCRLLAFWTGKNAEQMDRLFRRSQLMRDKWDERHGAQTYGAVTIAKAIETQDEVYTPARKRDDRRVLHPYDWQQAAETPQEREKQRRQRGAMVKERVRAHLVARDSTLLVVTAPPGSGKSWRVAELGSEGFDLAYIAERHDQTESIEALKWYNHSQPPSAANCPQWTEHKVYAELGYNTSNWHLRHGCDYGKQFYKEGSSTLYMVEHVSTPYPAKHKHGAVLDELNLAKWLLEHKMTAADVWRARKDVPPDSQRATLLRAVEDTLLEVESANNNERHPPALHGVALFDALNRHCGGRLAAVLQMAELEDDNLATRRTLTSDNLQLPDFKTFSTVGHLVEALLDELPLWEAGKDWNGLVRLALVPRGGKRYVKEWVVGVTKRRRFYETPSSLVLLDATSNAEVLRRLFDMPVQMVPAEVVTPPPRMRHLHLHTRYSKTSLTSQKGADLQRVIKQARRELKKLNPDGSKKVALITHQSCEDKLAQALGIPAERRGHFWGIRGSNKLEEADILFVVGTPALPPDEVARLARALYVNDPTPIDETSETVESVRHYRDERMRTLTDYLTNAELTQCAHRNRPLWHDGRMVVSFCQGTIDQLPVTETINGFPQLEDDGSRTDESRRAAQEVKLRQAYAELVQQGKKPTVRRLQHLAHVQTQAASDWLQAKRRETVPGKAQQVA